MKYTTPCPPMGCGVVERHIEMTKPTKTVLTNGRHGRPNQVITYENHKSPKSGISFNQEESQETYLT